MISAASAAAQKLGVKVKQMDIVMAKLSEREVLIKRCGKSQLWSPALHLRRFSYSLSQVRGIASYAPINVSPHLPPPGAGWGIFLVWNGRLAPGVGILNR